VFGCFHGLEEDFVPILKSTADLCLHPLVKLLALELTFDSVRFCLEIFFQPGAIFGNWDVPDRDALFNLLVIPLPDLQLNEEGGDNSIPKGR
jgi:hypothetical protein